MDSPLLLLISVCDWPCARFSLFALHHIFIFIVRTSSGACCLFEALCKIFLHFAFSQRTQNSERQSQAVAVQRCRKSTQKSIFALEAIGPVSITGNYVRLCLNSTTRCHFRRERNVINWLIRRHSVLTSCAWKVSSRQDDWNIVPRLCRTFDRVFFVMSVETTLNWVAT